MLPIIRVAGFTLVRLMIVRWLIVECQILILMTDDGRTFEKLNALQRESQR